VTVNHSGPISHELEPRADIHVVGVSFQEIVFDDLLELIFDPSPATATATGVRSDVPWVCGGKVGPGLSRMTRTFDCGPSRRQQAR